MIDHTVKGELSMALVCNETKVWGAWLFGNGIYWHAVHSWIKDLSEERRKTIHQKLVEHL
jgi:hypothetical protein